MKKKRLKKYLRKYAAKCVMAAVRAQLSCVLSGGDAFNRAEIPAKGGLPNLRVPPDTDAANQATLRARLRAKEHRAAWLARRDT